MVTKYKVSFKNIVTEFSTQEAALAYAQNLNLSENSVLEVVEDFSDIELEASLSRSVATSREIADRIIEAFKLRNLKEFIAAGVSNETALLKSVWTHHRLRAVTINIPGLGERTIDVMNLCISGDLETAYFVLQFMQPDDMSQPDHFLNQETIDFLKNLIAVELGL